MVNILSVETFNRPSFNDNTAGPRLTAAGEVLFPEGSIVPGRGRYRLGRAVMAAFEATEDGVVVRSAEFDEESYGSTLEEAVADFVTSLRDRYISMRRRRDRLSPGDRAVLTRLKAVLVTGSLGSESLERRACEYVTSNEPFVGSLAQIGMTLATMFTSTSTSRAPTTP